MAGTPPWAKRHAVPIRRLAPQAGLFFVARGGPRSAISAAPMSAGSYVERPKARPAGRAGGRRLAGSAPPSSGAEELSLLRSGRREATSGRQILRWALHPWEGFGKAGPSY
jgi:hypothetical protein